MSQRQDPYASFARVAQDPAKPQQQEADPYAAFAVRQDPTPAQQAQRPQPRPQAQPQAPAQPQTVGDTGLSVDEIYEAQRSQGYSDEEINRFLGEMGFVEPTPITPEQRRPAIVEVSEATQTPYVWEQMTPQEREALNAGDQVTVNGRTVVLAGSPEIGKGSGEEVAPGVYLEEINPDALNEVQRRTDEGGRSMRQGAALLQGAGFGFLEEATAPIVGLGERGRNLGRRLRGEEIPYTAEEYERAYRLGERSAQRQFSEENPLESGALNIVGGLAAPGGAAASRFIMRGAGSGAQAARAGAVGAGYGAAYGAGSGEGNLLDRAPEAFEGAIYGGAGGAVTQRALGGLMRPREVTPQRRLSREGVDLTLGQMLEPTPIIGGTIRATEDRMAGFPVVGDVIQGARQRTLESVNAAGVNRALAPIGESLPKGTKAGFEAVEAAQDRLGNAYADVLGRVSLQLDQPLYDDIGAIVAESGADMGADRARQFGEILRSRVFRNTDDANATIPGEEFKRIESALGQQQRQLARSLDSDQQALGYALGEVRRAFRDALARQNPMEAPRLQEINTGYANLVRMEEAAGAPGSLQRGGVATPAQIAAAVRRNTGTRSQRGRGAGLMADFAEDAGRVVPSTVADSGTAGRGALAAMLATGGAILKPEVAVPIIAAAGPYTQPGQRLLNIIYRSTDRAGQQSALARLNELARRDPALVPYYEAAAQQFLPEPQTNTPEPQRAQQ